MEDYYIKVSTYEDLLSLAPTLFTEGPDGEIMPKPSVDFALDLIGPICIEQATFDATGDVELTPAVWDNDYHANLRATPEFYATLDPAIFVDAPANPRRVFA